LLALPVMGSRGKRWSRLATAAVIAGAVAPGVMRWVRRTGAARRAVDLRMTVAVDRPINAVFEFCRDFENFPEVVDLQLEVQDFQDGRSRWQVRSPTGEPITWDATITKYVPNSVIAWESVPGAPVVAGGLMRFAPLSPGATRVDIVLTYRPLETRLTEAVRALMARGNATRVQAQVRAASHDLSAERADQPEALGPAA
jgi:uncharacterized membrane protein